MKSTQTLREQFLQFDLEDKIILKEGRTDGEQRKAISNATQKAKRATARKATMGCMYGPDVCMGEAHGDEDQVKISPLNLGINQVA